METIADRIKMRRKELGLSQVALAKGCGAHAITVARWETGQMKPGATHVERLADTLGVPVGWLIQGGKLQSVPIHEISRPQHTKTLNQIRKQLDAIEKQYESPVSGPESIIRSVVSRMPRCELPPLQHFGYAAADEQDGRHFDGDRDQDKITEADAVEPRAITVRGSSAEEFARDGQQCVIDIAHVNVAVGDLCVVLTHDQCLRLKRKAADRGRQRIYPSINRDFPPFEVAAREVVAEFPVVGVLAKSKTTSPVETVNEGFPV